MELERRRITKEEGLKAQRAMEALVAGNSGGTSVKAEDVDFVVSQWRSGKLCRAYC
jgi:hypothetical protein